MTAWQLAGIADLCELTAAAFAFPATDDLAQALADGAFLADVRACMDDAGVSAPGVDAALVQLEGLIGTDAADLYGRLRREYSLLFIDGGAGALAWPYESAFKFVAAGRSGEPSLFRSPVALDVERAMRSAGLVPYDARTEPVDSVWNELCFLSQLLGTAAAALDAGDLRVSDDRLGHAITFVEKHAGTWLPGFFERTARCADEKSLQAGYAALVYVGMATVGALAPLALCRQACR